MLRILLSVGFYNHPRSYTKLLYIDFHRGEEYLPFNVLNQPYASHTVARHMVEVCRRVWPSLADGAAPQFENTLLPAIVTLVENNEPLTSLHRLLTDKPYRDTLLAQVSDPHITGFFHERFDKWGREAPMMIESTLRRAFLLTFHPELRFTLGQKTNSLNFRALMDSRTCLLFNLGGLDEETQKVLGCLISVGFEEAALSREDIPERQRHQYHLLMDEFSMFSAQSEESLARVLSLARKYGLYLTLAHQTWSQLSSRMQGALQNAIEICFKLGRHDAQHTAPRFMSFDPYLLKHEVSDPWQIDRTHPMFFNIQEQMESWIRALEELQPRHAWVAVGKKSVQIRTLSVDTSKARDEDVAQVEAEYARRLLTPRAQIVLEEPTTEESTPPARNTVRRRGAARE